MATSGELQAIDRQASDEADSDVVVMGKGPVVNPVSAAELSVHWPQLASLEPIPRAVLTGVMNLQPAPCLPCIEEDLSLARCALSPPAGCENLKELLDRGARLAAAGSSPGAVRAVLTYGDPWTPEPLLTTPGWPAPDAAVDVELWVDPTWGPWRAATKRAGTLVDEGRSNALVGALSTHIRLLSTWQRRGKDHASADFGPLVRALAAADALGQGLPMLQLLAQAPADHVWDDRGLAAKALSLGLAAPEWKTALSQADQRVQADQDAALRLGLQSAPSWRVDGYILNGHRSVEGLRDVIENQRVDHLEVLPDALLAPWDPGLGGGASAPPAASPAPSPASAAPKVGP